MFTRKTRRLGLSLVMVILILVTASVAAAQITDIYVIASNSSTAPSCGEDKQIGYWDVDDSGGHGYSYDTGKVTSSGSYMMSMCASKASSSTCVQGVVVLASGNDTTQATSPYFSNYRRIGDWDVDDSGSVGAIGTTGTYMMGLYIKKGTDHCITSIWLTASDSSKGPNPPQNYGTLGWWDVDSSGGKGTGGSSGNYMMGFYREP